MMERSGRASSHMMRKRRPAAPLVLLSLWLLGVVAGCAQVAVAPSWTYREFQEVTFDPFPGMSFHGRPGSRPTS